ncbi:MAG: hypothetical protein ABW185_29180 [Sedimenticola sp.]
MKINKLQRMQLISFQQFKDTEIITIKSFLGIQNKAWWFLQVFLIIILVTSELTNTSGIVLRTIFAFGIIMQLMIFARAKLYWPILRQCIDWEKVNRILQESKS